MKDDKISAEDYKGVLFDLHRAAMGVVKGRLGTATALLFRAMERMDRILDEKTPDSSVDSDLCETDRLFTLQSFVLLARFAKRQALARLLLISRDMLRLFCHKFGNRLSKTGV